MRCAIKHRRPNSVFSAQSTLAAIAVTFVLLLAPAATAQEDTELGQAALREFNATAALQNSGFYARAGERWTKFLEKYPENERLAQVHYYLGICQLQTDKYPEAIQTFQTILSKFPQFEKVDGAQLNLGMAHFQMASESRKPEDHATAAEALAVVQAKHPQSPHAAKAIYFQAESLYAAGDPEAAVAAYQKLVQTYKDSSLLAEAHYALGTTLQELDQHDDAVAAYQAFLANANLEKHELAPEIRLRLAMTLQELKKYAEAEKLFAQVAASPDARFADFALLRQAECLVENGQPEEAVKYFVELPKRFPESDYVAPSQLAAGKCYLQMEKFDDAFNSLSPVATSEAEGVSGEASYWLGRTLLQQNKPQEAFAHLDEAAKRHTEGPFAPYIELTRINALFELPDRRQEAAPLYAEFATRFSDHPLRPQASYMSAVAALDQQDYAAAQRRTEAFLADATLADHALLPDVIYIAAESQLLARQQGANGDLTQAEQLYRRLVEKHPDHDRAARSHLRIGWCLHQSEKHVDALKYLNEKLPKLDAADHKAEAQLMIGRCHSATGEHQQAVAAFDAALQAKPDWSRADETLLAAARSLHTLEKLPEATQRLTTLLNTHPESEHGAHATFELAEIAQQQEKLDEAVQHFHTVTEKYAESELAAPAHYGVASARFAQQKYPDAIASLSRVLTDFANSPVAVRARYLRGLAHQRSDQFQQAVDDLQAFIESKPEGDLLHDARYALALCQAGLKQYDQAVVTLDQLLNEKSDYSHADKVHYERGHALVALEKPAEAAQAFRKLGETWPQSPLAPECWFHVGQFHESSADDADEEPVKQEQLAVAAEAYEAGVALESSSELHEKLRYKLGDMQFRMKKFAPAVETFAKQMQDHPKGELVGAARFLSAESLYRLERVDEALPLFIQVAEAKVEPYEAQALYRSGACAGQLKRWPESQKQYTTLLEQFPEFSRRADARYGLGLALQNQNKLAEARSAYEQVTEMSETETAAKARFMIGEIAFAEKKYEDAIEHFLEVTVGYPYKEWQALAQFETGRCFMELDQNEKAIAAFKKLTDQFPEHPKAKDATQLLAKLNR